MMRFNQVNKRYPGGYQALKNVSFNIAESEMVFLTWRSRSQIDFKRRRQSKPQLRLQNLLIAINTCSGIIVP
jgi:hypothetical protein